MDWLQNALGAYGGTVISIVVGTIVLILVVAMIDGHGDRRAEGGAPPAPGERRRGPTDD